MKASRSKEPNNISILYFVATLATLGTLVFHMYSLNAALGSLSIVSIPDSLPLFLLALSSVLFLIGGTISLKNKRIGQMVSMIAALAGLAYYVVALYGFLTLTFIFFLFSPQLWVTHILPMVLLVYLLVKSGFMFRDKL